jgi:hypothetical protein
MTPRSKTTLPLPSAEKEIPVTPDTRTLPLHDTVAQSAYSLWKKYGEPAGRSNEIWLEAERQLLGADLEVNQQETGAVSAHTLSEIVAPEPNGKTKQ